MHQMSRIVVQSGRAILGQSSRNGSSYGSVAYKPATMNDMPVPVGSWQNHYNANQRKYNTHLFSGIAFSLFTLVVGAASGSFYLNPEPEMKN